jgi:hypothetical protein
MDKLPKQHDSVIISEELIPSKVEKIVVKDETKIKRIPNIGNNGSTSGGGGGKKRLLRKSEWIEKDRLSKGGVTRINVNYDDSGISYEDAMNIARQHSRQ